MSIRADYTVQNQSTTGTRLNLQPVNATEIEAGVTTYTPSTLYIGTAGNVTVTTAGGDAGVEFVNLPNGSILPVLVTAVTAATATDLVLLS
jgi:hypothetical protein